MRHGKWLKYLGVVVCVVLAVCITSQRINAMFRDDARVVLRGVHAVCVVVESVKSRYGGYAPDKSEIERAVATRLKEVGIKIISQAEFSREKTLPGTPILYVQIELVPVGSYYAMSVGVSLREFVVPLRGLKIGDPFVSKKGEVCGTYIYTKDIPLTVAPTWSQTSLATVGSNKVESGLQKILGEHVNAFISDYAMAHKQSGG